MIYFILILLFIAVFAFLAWRVVITSGKPRDADGTEGYVCPVCDERHCECHKKRGPE